ncbi:hypothetical protein LTR09_005707 [Extremus antarcticus]|uniref:Uncharacterized protein n=1 Tax=Extremus antarcticus TaxID=702011 RepID=A0AAJ0DFL5_9PEZI|nr:hypothetical protein LTR09_005707 [Extremus antarcticus]
MCYAFKHSPPPAGDMPAVIDDCVAHFDVIPVEMPVAIEGLPEQRDTASIEKPAMAEWSFAQADSAPIETPTAVESSCEQRDSASVETLGAIESAPEKHDTVPAKRPTVVGSSHEQLASASVDLPMAVEGLLEHVDATSVDTPTTTEGSVVQLDSVPASTANSVASRKRAASTVLEQKVTKAAKVSEEGAIVEQQEEVDQTSTAADCSVSQHDAMSRGSADPTESRKRVASSVQGKEVTKAAKVSDEAAPPDYQQLYQRAVIKGRRLEKEVAQNEEDVDRWRAEAVCLRAEVADLEEQVKDLRKNSRGANADNTKRLQQATRDDYKQKLEAKIKAMNGKLQEERDRHDGVVDELKEKHKLALKAKEDAYKKKEEASKKQLNDLKEKHKAEFTRHKPEVTARNKKLEKELEEKDAAITEYKKETKRLSKQEQDLGQKVDELAAGLGKAKHMTEVQAKKEKTLEDCIKKQSKEKKKLNDAKDALEEEYYEKLTHEAKRWQLQSDKADKFERELVQQRRAAFALRTAHERKDAEILELRLELELAKRGTEEEAIAKGEDQV